MSTPFNTPVSAPIPSEDIVAKKFDACVADLIVKTGVGFSVGVALSVIVFKRRTWPVALATGFGIGQAYQNCDRSFNPYNVPGSKVLAAENVKRI
ncbi:Uncharacterized conserved protein [Phaffia rhodozyma]|uniref:MICOS complex subunit MIC10 n=1 Tax=Phaffia rhodozyma TaxID=264483 RepID=A0A0F7STY5_PHARH|nr:Uncharacterized conserved protein [Phaffia rhodozyma]